MKPGTGFQESSLNVKGSSLRKEKKMNNKMAIYTYMSIITLNANRLTAPIKRCTVAEWITKQDP